MSMVRRHVLDNEVLELDYLLTGRVVADVDVLGLLVSCWICGPLEGAFVVITQLSIGAKDSTPVKSFSSWQLTKPQGLSAAIA